MKPSTLSLYEQVGIVIPGTTVLFGLFFVSPELKAMFLRDGFGLGDFGLFVTVSYVAGHLVAAVGNALETLYWKPFGGMPSVWIAKAGQTVIAPSQAEKLERLIGSRLGLPIPTICGMAPGEWHQVFMQMTADVRASKADGRAEIFNANYGLNRGIAAGLLVVAVTNLVLAPTSWRVTLVALVLFGLALSRMHRFGVHYARAMCREFLRLPEVPTPQPQGSATESANG
ncbi:hypothetical protein ABMY26_33915 [Azospirillum sp. HJ39]|uniref:hypothetical protein n=1 Tax=Azospirillum sp. HJ39 TaxID=3159496 RepID=UPI00355857D2